MSQWIICILCLSFLISVGMATDLPYISNQAVVNSAEAHGASYEMKLDVDTYIDAGEAFKVFNKKKVLWATSVGGKPTRKVYLGFVNNFVTAGVSHPNDVKSATLKVHVSKVEMPGAVTAYFFQEPTFESLTWSDSPEYGDRPKATINVSVEGDYTLDATNILKKAVETCAKGCPFSIVLAADGDASIGFSSSEESVSNQAALYYSTA